MFTFSSSSSIGFACTPICGGYSWSWASVVYKLLEEVEARFGGRDKSFTFVGIEFTSGDVSQIWFPGSSKFVAIQLTDDARLDCNRALFQLAHEMIHLLAPAVGHLAPVLEEGLATAFSHEVAQRQGSSFRAGIPSYERAAELTNRLLELNPHAISQMRAIEPSFRRITPDLINSVVPTLDPQVSYDLCANFVR